jgi:citrate synthase
MTPGHWFDRVYKNFDPRAKIIREIAEEVFDIAGRDPLIDVAVALEKAARGDDFFVKRNLYPNVDFYSGADRAARRALVPGLYSALVAGVIWK